MLETLRIINTDFQAALDKFWRDYVSQLPRDETYAINTADKALQGDREVLTQVLNMREHARKIKLTLNGHTLRSLERKED